MTMSWTRIIPVVVLIGLVMAGCRTTRDTSIGTGSYDTTAGADAATVAATPNRAYGTFEHDTSQFNEASARRVCVDNLQVYEAYLQDPDQPAKNLEKPVFDYIRDAGGARQAIEVATVEIALLNDQLDRELANRDPFNALSRDRADDSIARIEDGILLNEALIEALQCHL